MKFGHFLTDFDVFVNVLAHFLPNHYYKDQIALSLEGPFLTSVNESEHTLTLMLSSGSNSIDVSF